jgi:hypothetical protein
MQQRANKRVRQSHKLNSPPTYVMHDISLLVSFKVLWMLMSLMFHTMMLQPTRHAQLEEIGRRQATKPVILACAE